MGHVGAEEVAGRHAQSKSDMHKTKKDTKGGRENRKEK